MPGLWLERSATAAGAGRRRAFSPADRRAAVLHRPRRRRASTLPLVDGGRGAEADFARLGPAARGAFVLIETEELHDIDGLFREYGEAPGIERRAFAAGASGLVVHVVPAQRSARPPQRVDRARNTEHPMLMMERDAAARALRLLRSGKRLTLTAVLDLQSRAGLRELQRDRRDPRQARSRTRSC